MADLVEVKVPARIPDPLRFVIPSADKPHHLALTTLKQLAPNQGPGSRQW